ncbi:hypothetical protein [Ensifer adhaerens]|nr:hypothetical protein [Ensifer adhaerens]
MTGRRMLRHSSPIEGQDLRQRQALQSEIVWQFTRHRPNLLTAERISDE